MVEPATTEASGTVAEQGDRLSITVSILPQKYFVEKIGGDRVQVNVMVPKGSEPEFYEPKPQQFKEVSNADAYLGLGMLFEDIWGKRLTTANNKMLVVDTSVGITKLPMADHGHEEAHDGEKHGEEGLDPHIWLSPRLVAIQAQNIYATLVKLDPAGEAVYAANLENFLKEIATLDQAIASQLQSLSHRKILVFHPSWGYFAKDYNLEQIPIEVEGKEPSAAELGELVTLAKAENIQVIFAQYQFNAQAAEAIASDIGAEVLYLDPLAEDWGNNLQNIATAIATANNKP